VIGKAYFGQGKNPLAMQHIERYVNLERSRYGDEHPKTLIALSEWAGLLFYRGDLEPARQAYLQILPSMRKNVAAGNLPADSLANALNIYACVRRTQGDSHEAEMLFREALELSPQLNEDDRRLINGTTRSTLASALSDQGRFDEALEESRKAVDEAISIGATDEPNYGFALTVLGGFLTEAGRYDEADAALRQGESVIRKFLSPAGLWMGDNLRNQAILAYQRGNYPEALTRSEEAMAIYRDAFGTHYDHYPTAMIVHGSSSAKMGNVKEGEAEIREALRMRSETLPPEHYWVAVAKGALGECLAAEGRYSDAEPLLTQSFESLKASQGDVNPRTEAARQRLNVLYQQMQRPDLIAKHLPQ
jgi:tetratricopeptide (TPR) repeat protein